MLLSKTVENDAVIWKLQPFSAVQDAGTMSLSFPIQQNDEKRLLAATLPSNFVKIGNVIQKL